MLSPAVSGQRSDNRVIRFSGDDERIVVTVEAHAYDREGAIRAAVREVASFCPVMQFSVDGEPRLMWLTMRSVGHSRRKSHGPPWIRSG